MEAGAWPYSEELATAFEILIQSGVIVRVSAGEKSAYAVSFKKSKSTSDYNDQILYGNRELTQKTITERGSLYHKMVGKIEINLVIDKEIFLDWLLTP